MMSMKNAVNWFEIPVDNVERAIKFYENMLDTKLQRETMNDIEFAIFPTDDTAVSGALVKCDFLKPSQQGSLVYLNVDGFMDEAISRAELNGAEVVFPKKDIGECGFIAHINDCEGNKVALHSM
jgi:uncharacterized protein